MMEEGKVGGVRELEGKCRTGLGREEGREEGRDEGRGRGKGGGNGRDDLRHLDLIQIS
jgi:hypothetical protein